MDSVHEQALFFLFFFFKTTVWECSKEWTIQLRQFLILSADNVWRTRSQHWLESLFCKTNNTIGDRPCKMRSHLLVMLHSVQERSGIWLEHAEAEHDQKKEIKKSSWGNRGVCLQHAPRMADKATDSTYFYTDINPTCVWMYLQKAIYR